MTRRTERVADRPRQVDPLPSVAEPPRLEPEAPRAVALAQFRNSFIVAEDPEGLMLVDQHAAHERVLYERYLDAI